MALLLELASWPQPSQTPKSHVKDHDRTGTLDQLSLQKSEQNMVCDLELGGDREVVGGTLGWCLIKLLYP